MRISQDNLYDNNPTVAPSTNNNVDNSSNSFGDGVNDLFSNLSFDFSSIVLGLNTFVLAWVLFHTFLYTINSFVFYFRISTFEHFLQNSKTGLKYFYKAVKMFRTYVYAFLPVLFFAISDNAIVESIFGIIAIAALSYKLFYDIKEYSPVFKVLNGTSGYLDGTLFGEQIKDWKKPFKGLGGKKEADGKTKGGLGIVSSILGGIWSVITGAIMGILSIFGVGGNGEQK